MKTETKRAKALKRLFDIANDLADEIEAMAYQGQRGGNISLRSHDLAMESVNHFRKESARLAEILLAEPLG